MTGIVLLDTSIYLNVLDVPRRNQKRDAVRSKFVALIEAEAHFLLPVATIWETGNHIARCASGGMRREVAQRFLANVTKALEGGTPYKPTHFPDRGPFLDWLREFPEYAMRQKSEKKRGEGVSLSDLSIIKEWERAGQRHPARRVWIWSLDADLRAYDTQPDGS